MKSIIIVGLGSMGLAHLSSFIKSKEKKRLFLVERDVNQHKQISKLLDDQKIYYEILKEIPKNKSFDFGVISSKSKERLQICKKLIINNKIRFLFLEKFLFNDLNEYKIFYSLKKRFKIKTYVNIWSQIFLKRVNLKKNDKKIFIEVILPNKKILTNLIHFFEIFRLLTGNNFKIDLTNFNLKKINKTYYDGNGEIRFKSKKNSIMLIKSKKMDNNIIFTYNSANSKKKIIISKGIIQIYKNSKILKKKFPLASIETSKLYRNLSKIKYNHKIFFPQYPIIEKSSKIILKSFFKKFKKRVKIS
ncbi:MAG: hypothetical protein CBD34_00220 [Rickettsiales bacterium TMED174]|nr:MAG: hypothetical protein CBD34_00220 [Rickettsiales bacterium TMED174]